MDDLDAFLESCAVKCAHLPHILIWERGKHARITDPDGDLIDLYEELLSPDPL